ncbi:MAG: hypothetical protein R3D85_06850 [Paracoccaceae bacterium]
MPAFISRIDAQSETFAANAAEMQRRLDQVHTIEAQAEAAAEAARAGY